MSILVDASVHAFNRRVSLFLSRLSAYVSRPDVRLVSETPRANLDTRNAYIRGFDG